MTPNRHLNGRTELTAMRSACVGAVWCLVVGLLAPHRAAAQYADSPRMLAAVDQSTNTATPIGRRLFIGGFFSRVSVPTGGAVVVDTAGTYVPGSFPRFDGPVRRARASTSADSDTSVRCGRWTRGAGRMCRSP